MKISHIIVPAALFMVASSPAYAYLDPGTGSMILQAVIGTLAVGAAAIAGFWYRIRAFFSGTKNSDATSNSEASSEENEDNNTQRNS